MTRPSASPGEKVNLNSRGKDWLYVSAFLGFCLGAILLGIIALSLKLTSVVHQSDVYVTSVTEEFSVYAIWRVQNGFPLYQFPYEGNYILTLYNFMFYYFYAYALSIFGVENEGILLYGKLVSLGFGVIGFAGSLILFRRMTRDRSVSRWGRTLGQLVIAGVWVTSNFIQLFSLTIRPDMAGWSFVVLGLLAAITCIQDNQNKSIRLAVLASFFFWLAWSFKQSLAISFACTCLYVLLVRRDWKLFLGLCLPFAFLTALSIFIGGEAYTYNILEAPKLTKYSISKIPAGLIGLVASNIFIFTFVLFFIGRLIGPQDSQSFASEERRSEALKEKSSIDYLLFLSAGNLIAAFPALARVGSVTNSFFELYLVVGLLAAVVTARAFSYQYSTVSRSRVYKLAVLFTAVGLALAFGASIAIDYFAKALGSMFLTRAAIIFAIIAFPFLFWKQVRSSTKWIAILASVPMLANASLMAGQLRHSAEGVYRLHPLVLGTKEDTEVRRRFAAYLKSLRKPLFIKEPPIFSLPWHATDNKYPAIMIDGLIHTKIRRLGILKGGGVEKMIESRYFSTLVLTVDDPLYKIAISAGYNPRPVPRAFRDLDIWKHRKHGFQNLHILDSEQHVKATSF